MLIAKAKRKVKKKKQILTVVFLFAMFSMKRREDLQLILQKKIRKIRDNLKLKRNRFQSKIPGIQSNQTLLNRMILKYKFLDPAKLNKKEKIKKRKRFLPRCKIILFRSLIIKITIPADILRLFKLLYLIFKIIKFKILNFIIKILRQIFLVTMFLKAKANLVNNKNSQKKKNKFQNKTRRKMMFSKSQNKKLTIDTLKYCLKIMKVKILVKKEFSLK
jgi:hypothetical protein